MFRGRAKGRAGTGNDSVQKVPLKGLFSDGIWKCNCDPRMTAQRLQTKNGGNNHGRWCMQLPIPIKRNLFQILELKLKGFWYYD